MLKWSLTIAAALAMVVGVVSCWTSVVATYVTRAGRIEGFRVAVDRGGVSVSHGSGAVVTVLTPGWSIEKLSYIGGPEWWVDWYTTASARSSAWGLFVPLWLIALPLAVPAAWLWYKDRRRAPWQCSQCGYDRRGLSPPDACCPECGADPATKSSRH